tara:strand:+ start:1172 stop:1948 length:777 start_codon:yes stop_codon:yes gene_type:complete
METIKLLDAKEWKLKELLEKMKDDSFYYGEGSKLMLSNSGLSDILKSPKKYYYKLQYGEPESQPLRDGWLFHTSILEPDVFEKQIFVDVASKNTKAYKLAKEEHGRVFTMTEKEDAQRLQDAFYKNSAAVSLIGKSEFEVPIVGNIEKYPFRGKADVLKNTGGIIDLKTTSNITHFEKSANLYHYDLQAYVYCNLFDISYKDFKFIALDKGTLDIGIFDVSLDFYLRGEQKLLKAIKLYETYFIYGEDLNEYTLKGTL